MGLSVLWEKWPLLDQVRDYRRAWIQSDLAAGLSVAAVSLPSAIAYPAIAGLPMEVGLYATIFSMIGYAFLGWSRKLMVGPDTATCIILASVLTSLGAVEQADRVSLTLVLSITVGLFCLAAGALRLGFLANFLSRPMLAGFLAGISISLVIGQIERLTGLVIETDGLLRPIVDLTVQIREVHLPTLAFGLGSLALLRLLRYATPTIPGPPLVILGGIALSAFVDLDAHGIAIVGAIPPVSFQWSIPDVARVFDLDLLGGALGIMLVSFGSGLVTARSFASKESQSVNANLEMVGIGAANICSGLFGGFPVSASDSRTAVNYAIGGRTQLTALVAAGTLAVSVLFISGALSLVPQAVLGAILVSAAIDLIDLTELRALRQLSPVEFFFAMLTMLAVVLVGVLQGILIAIAATLAHLLWDASKPKVALLGRIPGSSGLFKLHRFPEAKAIPGLTVVVLESPLVFFNAEFARQRLQRIADAAAKSARWFILDAAAINALDSTGIATLESIRGQLAKRGIAFGIADLNSDAKRIVERAGLQDRLGQGMLFPSAEAAVAAYEAANPNNASDNS